MKTYLIILGCICLIVVPAGIYLGGKIYKYAINETNKRINDIRETTQTVETSGLMETESDPVDGETSTIETALFETAPVYMSDTSPRVTAETSVVFEHVDKQGEVVARNQETVPYFLIGSDLESVKKTYAGWETVSFSADELILRKPAPALEPARYILGLQDGYVTVFYKDPITDEAGNYISNIKEITKTPATSLSRDEQERLTIGVEIASDDELYRALQDYGS